MQKESLAEFVRITRNDKQMSLMDVRMQSGKQLATSYISRIENGDVVNVGPKKLQALAKGLAVSEEILFSLVRGKTADPVKVSHERFILIADAYSGVPPQMKKDLEPFIAAIETALKNHLQNNADLSATEIEQVKKSKNAVIEKYLEKNSIDESSSTVETKKPSRRKAS